MVEAEGSEGGGDRLADGGEDGAVAVVVTEAAVGTEGVEGVEHQDHGDDDLAGAEDEVLEPGAGVSQDATQGGQVVGVQFEDEGHGFAGEQGVLEDEAGADGDADADQVEGEDDVLAVVGVEGGGEEDVDRQPGAAGHEGGHGHGHEAVAAVFEGAGGHDGGDVAAEADDQGDEGFAGQTEPAHEAVHDEGGPGHVAGVFEYGEEQEQAADDGDEGGDDLEAGAEALGQQEPDPGGGAPGVELVAEAVDQQGAADLFEEVDEGAAEVDGEEEHQVHQQQEQGGYRAGG